MFQFHHECGLVRFSAFRYREGMPEFELVRPVCDFHSAKDKSTETPVSSFSYIKFCNFHYHQNLFAMKRIIFCVTVAVLTGKLSAQQPAANPFPKTISVSGAAEMEVIPDQIFVNIVLREYQKKNEPKKDLETLKTNFMDACHAIGLPDSIISIASYTGFNNYYWLRKDRKKTPDLFTSITYQVKFSNSKQMDELIEKLDDEATQSFDIVNTSHSKMPEYRKQLKIMAVKAAKDKGIYLTEAIGEKLGPAITVTEPNESGVLTTMSSNRVFSQANMGVNTRYDGGNDKTVEIDFKRIKLRYEVSVVFALQ
jgi:uncharacterized protein YggE